VPPAVGLTAGTLPVVEREALIRGDVQPGGREPAPGSLRLVQAFVNTVDREHGPDLFGEPAGLAAWLEWNAMPAAVAADDLGPAVELREALRTLLHVNNGAPDDPAARAALDRAARRARLEAAFGPGGPALVPRADAVDGVLGQIVAAVFAAMLGGEWRRLKACPRAVCGWAFYDRSSNASATWCSMRVCGGREKASAYYRRRARSRA
jgi:predicted RNA-binding Zn ribbon-like protein